MTQSILVSAKLALFGKLRSNLEVGILFSHKVGILCSGQYINI